MYSANLIRTTHLTGTTTDIGLFFGQYVRVTRPACGNFKYWWVWLFQFGREEWYPSTRLRDSALNLFS
jgi:hypothetical protein